MNAWKCALFIGHCEWSLKLCKYNCQTSVIVHHLSPLFLWCNECDNLLSYFSLSGTRSSSQGHSITEEEFTSKDGYSRRIWYQYFPSIFCTFPLAWMPPLYDVTELYESTDYLSSLKELKRRLISLMSSELQIWYCTFWSSFTGMLVFTFKYRTGLVSGQMNGCILT